MILVSTWVWLVVGTLVGALLASAHMALLRHAIDRSRGLSGKEAKKRLIRGMWVRIGIWIPVLAGAAYAGLWACLGVILGSLLGRWLIVWRSSVA